VAEGQTPQARRAGNHSKDARAPEPGERAAVKLRSAVPAEIRDASFSAAVRGYDRREVDAYVQRVNRVIAELEISRSPQSAVKHALDRVGEQTSGVLQRAREVADELMATALAQAETTTREAKAEADEVVEQAQLRGHQLRGESKEQAEEIVAKARAQSSEELARMQRELKSMQDEVEARLRELELKTDAISLARATLLDDLRRIAAELVSFADGAQEEPQAPREPQASLDGPRKLQEPGDPQTAGDERPRRPPAPGEAEPADDQRARKPAAKKAKGKPDDDGGPPTRQRTSDEPTEVVPASSDEGDAKNTPATDGSGGGQA
jgi:DivIVA domain-containing protein